MNFENKNVNVIFKRNVEVNIVFILNTYYKGCV